MRRNHTPQVGLMQKSGALALTAALGITSLSGFLARPIAVTADEPVITLRVCNWEEYIDEGDWDEEETIDLESGDIIGINPLYEDFEEWYYENYGVRVKVEYSCFGTNEELYNMLTLGDEYDLVCPSDYLIMKLMAEDWLVPFSEDFFDADVEDNYYTRGVSPYIRDVFVENTIEMSGLGEVPWRDYAACYMWGLTGILYNPELMTEEEASTWTVVNNPDFCRQITIKDNVRDTYFMAVGAIKTDLLSSEEFINDPNYHENLAAEMNDVSPETIALVQDYLQEAKNNVYSFETDSGKADMITGKVIANYQWTGDAVYAMDEAEEDDCYLNFAIPKEGTNLWFDGWVMLKSGINGNSEKQKAAEAFINFLSRPDNAVRNMYYIGYTSAISGGEDGTVFEYLDWCYGAEEDEEDVVEYNVGYLFTDDPDAYEDYTIIAAADQVNRQLGAQYPSEEVIARCAIMQYFDAQTSVDINQMWINVRCFNILKMPVWGWILTVLGICGLAFLAVQMLRKEKKA